MTNQSASLSINDMLAADDTKYDTVEVWGGTVRLGSLNAADMVTWLDENDTKPNGNLRLFVMCIVDDAGNRQAPDDPEGRDALIARYLGKGAQETALVVNRSLVLNGLRDKKTVQALKNVSGETLTGVSPSV